MKPSAIAITLAFLVSACAGGPAPVDLGNLPTSKQTTLGLYVTAPQAWDMWQADPEHVVLVDVRTPEEYLFVGHPTGARNVPFVFVDNQWDAAKKKPVMHPNREFVDGIRRIAKPEQTLLLMCRSGGRSAAATDMLATAGFRNVYTVVDGFEGDMQKDKKSPDFGKRTLNGWRNAGLPWDYEVDPTSLVWPDEPHTRR
ncbi:MAG: sulfurtransferase [Planctomycetes bacterium]|nr:sulfurtransferase [Planctomycetota bacterium]